MCSIYMKKFFFYKLYAAVKIDLWKQNTFLELVKLTISGEYVTDFKGI